MDVARSVLPPAAPGDGRGRRRRRLLSAALVVHLLMGLFVALDGPDRVRGVGDGNAFDPSALLFAALVGWPAVLALLATLLPGQGPWRAALPLGVVALVLALVLVPLYGVGLLFVPGALIGLWAGIVEE